VAEAAVDPDQTTLVVLQVQGNGAARQRTRLDDHVELLVDQPRRALRHNLDPSLAQKVEQPVRTGCEQALELAVAEDQARLVAANLDVLEQHHGCTSFRINSASAGVLTECRHGPSAPTSTMRRIRASNALHRPFEA
jgi:hypothetical protein